MGDAKRRKDMGLTIDKQPSLQTMLDRQGITLEEWNDLQSEFDMNEADLLKIDDLTRLLDQSIDDDERMSDMKFQIMDEELEGINRLENQGIPSSLYNQGLRCLITAVSENRITRRESLHPDCDFKINVPLLKKAGELLNASGGFSEMQRAVVTYTPRHYHPEISMHWDGIGDWRQ